MTQVYADEQIASMHTQFFELTQAGLGEYQKSVFVDKSRLLSEKITKFNLLPIDHIPLTTTDKTSKTAKK